MSVTRSTASFRRIGVSIFILLLAAMLYGMAPAGSSPQGARPTPTPSHTGPRPTPTQTHSPRPTPTPKPTRTPPYPGGAGAPAALEGDAFFRVSDTVPPAANLASTMLWIALAMAALALAVRWFFLVSRNDREP